MTSVLDNHELLPLENNPLSGTSDMPNFVIIKIEAGNNAIYQFYLSNLNDVLQPPIINPIIRVGFRDAFSSSDFVVL